MLSKEEILHFIDDDNLSEKKKLAREGQRYYEADHDIKEYKLYYVDADGKLKEDLNRSNIKISHPFFTELVDQEVQYMLSGDEPFICSDNVDLQKRLDEYFDDDFRSELQECMTGAISKGFEHMYAYMSTAGMTRFMCADSLGVVEVRAKDTDDDTEYVIYWYTDRIEKGRKKIKRVQVWDSTQTWYYVQMDEGQLEVDTNQDVNPRPHITYRKNSDDALYADGNGGYGFIPFFRLDNNKKQFSGLKPVKALIDDYDLVSCGLSNNLQDVSEGLYVVKGFQGHDLDELIQNLKVKKHIGVDPEGGVEIKTIDIPYEARKVKLELDEKNIYRFGMGFNSAQVGDGNVTNVVIKSRYALLDLKCNKLEIRLKSFLRKMIKVVLDEINKADGTDYGQSDVWFNFQREVMTNATDNSQIEKADAERRQIEINTLLSLAAAIGDKKALQLICEVLDIDFDEVKDNISDMEEETATAQSVLEAVVPDGGGEIGEQ